MCVHNLMIDASYVFVNLFMEVRLMLQIVFVTLFRVVDFSKSFLDLDVSITSPAPWAGWGGGGGGFKWRVNIVSKDLI